MVTVHYYFEKHCCLRRIDAPTYRLRLSLCVAGDLMLRCRSTDVNPVILFLIV